MIDLQQGHFKDISCVWLGNGLLRLAVTTGWGPRVLFCGWEDGENLFAETPDLTEWTPNGLFHFLGGHRLWYAPESLSTTYWPDTWAIDVQTQEDGARFTAPADGMGIVKALEVTLAADRPEVSVRHVLRNTSDTVVELAPWALTMLRLGGVALFPQPQMPADLDGLLPNKHYVFWPYSDPADSRLRLGRRMALLSGRAGAAHKFGFRSEHGWCAYWLQGTLFVIRFTSIDGAAYPDRGCNVESYVKDRFLELETLGPLTRLEPGEAIVHDERWQLYADVPPIENEQDAVAAAAALGLWS
ncbi:MAG: hypothetical protein KatS3mg057_0647 [Herpetosiphonaceae bacterium]|nr:MAG: hypothetical protein KatS3mg057_0647 [Herpetosiphonaceae bacterium]